MNLDYLLKHPDLFQYAIGIKFSQFNALLPKFSLGLRAAEHKKAYLKPRLRDIGGGRKATLKTDLDKLFFILFYYKVYPTFRFTQILYGFDKKNVLVWKEFLAPVLFSALGYELSLKVRKHRINSFESWIEEYPQLLEFIVDCTERTIQRPKDNPEEGIFQKDYYSGKKKHHTIKNQIIVSPQTKQILNVSNTVRGTIHDKKLFDSDPAILRAPPGSIGMGDLGYAGVDKSVPHIKMVIPQKKPKGQELTESEKQNNKAISQIRVRVEHPFSYLKHFNILSNRYRGRVKNQQNLDLPIKTIAEIYNFTRPPT
jgi:hypothetical protein